MTLFVPPIKCQGIKTKLVPVIKDVVPDSINGTWIEPFCGSCVVALNVQPERAILADINKHIIALYRAIQEETVTPGLVRTFLEDEGATLARIGEDHYYAIRTRFNTTQEPLDFLFLSRACFNGVMRFNGKGTFNVPFCRKPERFSRAYVTKIVNQVRAFRDIVRGKDWKFIVSGFQDTLHYAAVDDFVYADPPYAGRHVDYYNSWSDEDEAQLATTLKALPCRFLLSTWHSNKYRNNPLITLQWTEADMHIITIEHFYHVGPTEDLRNAMTEALVANYPVPATVAARSEKILPEQSAFNF